MSCHFCYWEDIMIMKNMIVTSGCKANQALMIFAFISVSGRLQRDYNGTFDEHANAIKVVVFWQRMKRA